MPRPAALLTMVCLLAACPAPSPSSTAPRREPAGPPSAEPAGPPSAEPAEPAAPAPTRAVGDEPTPEQPAIEPAADERPAALAAARPVVRSLWHALEAVEAGDAAAMAAAMTDDGRWFPPGRPEESVGGATDLQRALTPWTGSDIDVRRIIDPGDGTFAAQVSVGSREDPELRHELVLRVEPRGELVAAVHHFGDPLGPLRQRSSPLPPSEGPGTEQPLALGPVGEPTLVGGPAETAAIAAAEQLVAAVDARRDAAVRTYLAADVVLHDVIARRTRRGREAWLAGMRQTLGPAGRLVVDRHLAGSRFVVVEGAVYGRETAAGDGEPAVEPQEHGFVDVHRFVDGTIAETWHYVNRRGRPHHTRTRP